MPPTFAELVRTDQEHLIHPLHHPAEHKESVIYARGRGAVVEDVNGKQYLDGLSGLWNLNVGHGRCNWKPVVKNVLARSSVESPSDLETLRMCYVRARCA